jgi:hypothetical protein
MAGWGGARAVMAITRASVFFRALSSVVLVLALAPAHARAQVADSALLEQLRRLEGAGVDVRVRASSESEPRSGRITRLDLDEGTARIGRKTIPIAEIESLESGADHGGGTLPGAMTGALVGAVAGFTFMTMLSDNGDSSEAFTAAPLAAIPMALVGAIIGGVGWPAHTTWTRVWPENE